MYEHLTDDELLDAQDATIQQLGEQINDLPAGPIRDLLKYMFSQLTDQNHANRQRLETLKRAEKNL